jgi:ribosomal protein S18 acetylase RimI-like enzyme
MEARLATESDVPVLLEMVRDFFACESMPYDVSQTEPALCTLLSNGELGHVWLFESDQQTVGYAIVTFGFDLEFGGRDAFLTDLFLLPDWRNRGEGKTAMRLLEREAIACGVRALHLLVDPKNERAVRLYEKGGFERSHRIAMTKLLAAPIKTLG